VGRTGAGPAFSEIGNAKRAIVTMPAAGHMGQPKKGPKLGVVSGVYIPVCLNILSILMFLRFGVILGQIGLVGMLALLVTSYIVDLITTLSLSAIASNGEVKGGGAYYLISRSLGPEFGGSIGLLFYLSQVLNTALNVVGLIDCIRLNVSDGFPGGYWREYALETAVLVACTALCLAGSGIFAKASNGLLAVLVVAIVSIPVSAVFRRPFKDDGLGIKFTGPSLQTLADNLMPHVDSPGFRGIATFRDLFGILFPATSGIFAGASMSGDLRNPSKAIPKGTLWAMLSTFIAYLVVIFSMASSTTHASFLRNANTIPATNLSPAVVFAGECAVTLFSALMGIIGSAKLLQALSRDRLLPGLSVFGMGTRAGDEPVLAIFLTYSIAQVALLADLNQIATFISMGYQITFFVTNLACFLLKIGSAPNFRPGFKFFSWQTALAGSLMSGAAMFFIDETYAAAAICAVVCLFLLIHYLSPPKRWGDVSQNLIYHQVRKYLLRLRPEHIKFWRPQIILLINNPRRQTRLIEFCNSMKKGSLYILGHVIVTDDFKAGVHEARLQQNAWTNYISEIPRLKAFVQLTMSPSINWGVRNLILSAGLGGMRPNIAVLGFYNMDELRASRPLLQRTVPEPPSSPTSKPRQSMPDAEAKTVRRRRGDTSARILEGVLPTDVIRTEEMMSAASYMTILEDLTLRYKLNVAVGNGFDRLETPRRDGINSSKYIDLWPIQMSAEILSDGKSVLTTNFDTYTLILQLGYILSTVPAWKRAFKLRVMVFVEYESEVAEEEARVRALLEKLRIEATAHVFWLACGQLQTYELIINGICDDMDSEAMVNDVLRDEEWWDELQRYRGRPRSMTPSRELGSLAAILDATAGRCGVQSPHIGVGGAEDQARRRPSLVDLEARRRPSIVHLRDMQTKPTVSKLSRLGVNVGIHTQHLADEVFDHQLDKMDDLDTAYNSNASESPSTSELDDVSDSDGSGGGGGSDGDVAAAVRRPLLGRKKVRTTDSRAFPKGPPRGTPRIRGQNSGAQSYGAISRASISGLTRAPDLDLRSPLSRQSSAVRFSSKPMPETRTNVEDTAGPTIMFAESIADTHPAGSRLERPGFSRQSHVGPRNSGADPVFNGGHDGGDRRLNVTQLRGLKKPGTSGDNEGSPYSTQNVALSFNDLPSRAQHIILNELMRKNSADAAVLMSTLPIPAEGTSSSEEATLMYLSDIEVLCNELPPVLLVLSNSMTVTVGL
jgi:solute carrier family 12 (potassium/chloride transporters), member 9